MAGFTVIRNTNSIFALFIISTILIPTGCGVINRSFGQYEENISHLLITQDEKFIVAIGRRYHYIFEAPTEIIETLKSQYLGYVHATFVNFEVNSNGTFTGTYKLNLNTRFNTADPYWADALRKAKELGYKPNGFMRFICVGKLNGNRYNADDVKIPDNIAKFERYYTIQVRKTDSIINNVPTPITVTGQSILYIGSMPIVAPAMGLAIFFNN